jgi:NAD(P)-dependent dehydrogenase (short-subunit alcohol dehydrogenase family)
MTAQKLRLSGKRAVVTGASLGIGRATAIRFGEEGARVALISRTRQTLEEVAEIIAANGGEALVLPADVTQEDQLAAAIDAAADKWGGLDIIVSNAGIELPFQDARVDKLDLSVWQTILTTNLTGQMLTCKHGIRQLLKTGGGAVVCLGSNVGYLGLAFNEPAYTASKGGIFALMRQMAMDFAKLNIRVNMVIPGFIDTPMNAYAMEDPQLLKTWVEPIPLGRAGTAEEVANAILFLASDEASYCIGEALVVDGGQSAV